MTSYASEYPASIPFDPAYKKFFEDFYAVSDTLNAHDRYVNSFTKDATLIMASSKAKGSDAILTIRKGLWEKVDSRLHHPRQIFPYGPNADEVMLHGTVEYKLKDGTEVVKDWGAYAHLVRIEGSVKMDFYQVYLDTAPPAK